MNKNLSSLAAAMLTASALAVIPAIASAGEYSADCEFIGCGGTIQSTGGIEITDTAMQQITCTSVTGNVSVTSNSSTGSVQLLFHGCKEQATIFKFSCTSPGMPSGTITTNTLVMHNVYIDPNKSTPGILVTGVNVTYNCGGGFSRKTVTGDLIGHIETPNCGSFVANHTVTFEETFDGIPKYTSVTTFITIINKFRANNHDGGSYTETSINATAHVNYPGDNRVKLTC